MFTIYEAKIGSKRNIRVKPTSAYAPSRYSDKLQTTVLATVDNWNIVEEIFDNVNAKDGDWTEIKSQILKLARNYKKIDLSSVAGILPYSHGQAVTEHGATWRWNNPNELTSKQKAAVAKFALDMEYGTTPLAFLYQYIDLMFMLIKRTISSAQWELITGLSVYTDHELNDHSL